MDSFKIKVLAALLMIIDHVGFFIFPEYEILRVIGRVSFPLFAFLIVNGFIHTKDVKKYFMRLFIFANVIQIPSLFISIPFNVMYTLSFGLLCLYIIELDESILKKIIGISAVVILTYSLSPDYSVYGLSVILLIYYCKKKWFFLAALMAFSSIMFYGIDIQLFSVLAVIPMSLYNYKQGIKMKYFFYIFYPLHIIILEGISYFINNN